VGEVGDSDRALQLMAEYTSGRDRLHMCYSFEMLGMPFSAEHFRTRVERFFTAGPHGWPCWSFSNHDVIRHLSRWAPHGADRVALGRQCAALLLSLRGSVCIYQGEELGLPEADLLFEELTDPPGIRFWPEYKGRDGCRTPMPWDEGEPPNGFTTGRPWLPVKPAHAALSVAAQQADPDSLLHFYRRMIAFRRAQPALVEGGIEFIRTSEPVLAFRRTGREGNLVCIFNLSPAPARVRVENAPPGTAPLALSGSAELSRTQLTLGPNGYAFLAEPPRQPLAVTFARRARRREGHGPPLARG